MRLSNLHISKPEGGNVLDSIRLGTGLGVKCCKPLRVAFGSFVGKGRGSHPIGTGPLDLREDRFHIRAIQDTIFSIGTTAANRPGSHDPKSVRMGGAA